MPGRSQPAIEKAESGLVRKAVRRAQRGDVEALHFLYLRYAPDVLCCVGKLVREDREAEEITLDVFQGLIGLMERDEVGRAPFLPWLLNVARDAALERSVSARRSAPSSR